LTLQAGEFAHPRMRRFIKAPRNAKEQLAYIARHHFGFGSSLVFGFGYYLGRYIPSRNEQQHGHK
jgi:hypothetical protein